MNPLGTRARIEELARLLDGAVSGPATLTGGHASLATRLRAVAPSFDAPSIPRPEFRTALRARLVAVATVQAATLPPLAAPAPAGSKALEAAVSWTQSNKAQRRIGVTAGAMAGVIAFTGVGVAASRSLPGQPFYGLKRGAEDVQLTMAQGDISKGSKHLEFAATRLREVRALAHGERELSLGGGSTGPLAAGATLGSSVQARINTTLSDFDAETSSGRSLLEKAYRTSGKPAPLRILTTFSSQQQVRLTSIIPDLPAGSQRIAQQSLQLVTEVGSTAGQLLSIGTCTSSCFPQGGGPTLPSEPVPMPGATASPSNDNNVPPCTCVQPASSDPTPSVDPSPSQPPAPDATPTDSPTETPSPTPSPTSTPSPSPFPFPLPSLPPIIPSLPPILPSGIPLPPLASLLPLLPAVSSAR